MKVITESDSSATIAAAEGSGTRTGQPLGRRAVVLGGSLSGLLAAEVLARYFDQVVIVDRDDLTAPEGGPRRGVPQSRHTHGLLVGGSEAMERLLPGLSRDLTAQGALRVDLNARLRWWLGGVEHNRIQDGGMEGLLSSRPLLENEVRRHVRRRANIVLLGEYDIAGLVPSADRRSVIGAKVASRVRDRVDDPNLIEDGVIAADLVLDASGRGSRAHTWLTELGYPSVPESVVEAGLTYVTRHFRQHPGVLDDLDGDIAGNDHRGTRGGVALRQEGGLWAVTLAGSFGEQPPTDLAGYQDFARSLPTQGLTEITTKCEPVGNP